MKSSPSGRTEARVSSVAMPAVREGSTRHVRMKGERGASVKAGRGACSRHRIQGPSPNLGLRMESGAGQPAPVFVRRIAGASNGSAGSRPQCNPTVPRDYGAPCVLFAGAQSRDTFRRGATDGRQGDARPWPAPISDWDGAFECRHRRLDPALGRSNPLLRPWNRRLCPALTST